MEIIYGHEVMLNHLKETPQDIFRFPRLNPGYNSVFNEGRMSIGLVVPIENYSCSAVPSMERHIERVQLAEELGFSSVWLRDVPFNVPSFDDAGQLFDPFVYLGALAAQTSKISLGVASIVLPLRHPAHVAKATASLNVLSDGRIILGIASGDRPEEFPMFGKPYEARGELFRESYNYIREISNEDPQFSSSFGTAHGGIAMLPKSEFGQLPLLVTGSSQQSDDWIAKNGDGWMIYPRDARIQSQIISRFRDRIYSSGGYNKPILEPLYIDLVDDPNYSPEPIHLGIKTGLKNLHNYMKNREEIGVNHIALNLRFNNAGIEKTLGIIANEILPDFM